MTNNSPEQQPVVSFTDVDCAQSLGELATFLTQDSPGSEDWVSLMMGLYHESLEQGQPIDPRDMAFMLQRHVVNDISTLD